MATLKELYQLVHALDKAEKRSVTIMIDAFGAKARQRYTNAFHILNEQKEFDADKLKQKLSAGVSGMNLTEANNNVFNFICRALYNHQAPATGNMGLVKDLVLVETFVTKGLFELAEKQLEPLLQKMEQGNSFGLLARGQELQSIITANLYTGSKRQGRTKNILDSRMQNARHHLQYLEVMQLNRELTELVQLIGEPREKKHITAYEKIYRNPIWQLPYSQISNKAFTMFAPLKLDMMTLLHGNGQQIKEGIVALDEFYKRFDVKHHYIVAFYLLDSILSDSIVIKDKATIQQYSSELRKLLPHAKQYAVEQKINAKLMQCDLVLDLLNQNYKQGIARLNDWMKPDNLSKWRDAPLAYINYLFAARLHYMAGNPAAALDYLNAIRDNEKDFREATVIWYWFLYLLCYYQLNQPSLVYSTASSIYKKLLRQKKLYAPERAVLAFAKSTGSMDKMQKNMIKLHKTLSQLQHDPLNQPFFQLADYIDWLEAGLNNSK